MLFQGNYVRTKEVSFWIHMQVDSVIMSVSGQTCMGQPPKKSKCVGFLGSQNTFCNLTQKYYLVENKGLPNWLGTHFSPNYRGLDSLLFLFLLLRLLLLPNQDSFPIVGFSRGSPSPWIIIPLRKTLWWIISVIKQDSLSIAGVSLWSQPPWYNQHLREPLWWIISIIKVIIKGFLSFIFHQQICFLEPSPYHIWHGSVEISSQS